MKTSKKLLAAALMIFFAGTFLGGGSAWFVFAVTEAAKEMPEPAEPPTVYIHRIEDEPVVKELITTIPYEVVVSTSATEEQILCKVVYGEAGGCDKLQQSAVVWCVLNRRDDPRFPDTIYDVVSQEGQFDGWNPYAPVTDEIREIVHDVLVRYEMEKICCGDVGRTLPKEYCWFLGDGRVNHYRNAYVDGSEWFFTLPNPYGGS